MADKKNQHYVPRVDLRPWSFNGEGKAIALFNIERRITIPSAPLKNQCSSNFFYGRDLVLEDWLADVEGDYGTLMSKLKSLGGQELSDALDFLREFSYLLYVRTERSVEQDMTFMDDMAKAIYRGEPQVLPERERTVKEAIIRWSETRHILSDLRAVLVSNATSVPFVTCDDPAVLTNRLSLQKHKMDFRYRDRYARQDFLEFVSDTREVDAEDCFRVRNAMDIKAE
jgi:hypothetical protein